jgi:hypothetical protein
MAGTAACVTAALRANCGPFNYPQIEGTSSGPTVSNDVWNPVSGGQQTLYANSPGDWYTVATGPAGNTAVVSYPSSGSDYNERSLSSFPALYSSFSENMNAQSYLPQGSDLTAIGYGFEICSTGGEAEKFTVNSFSITT